MSRTILPFLMLALSSAGCAAGTVKGTVAGETVPAMPESGWVSIDAGGPVYVELLTTDVPDACETFAAVAQAESDALKQLLTDFDTTRAQLAFEAAEQDNLPETYWTAALTVSADDLDAVVDDYTLDGTDASFVVTHVTGYTDWHDYFTTGVAGTQAITSSASSGSATVEALVEDKDMKASGEAEMADGDGADAGSVSFTMSGSFCEAYSDVLNSF